jgi:metallo-beta-lactamase family protein
MTRGGQSFEEIVHTIIEGEHSIIIASPAMLSGGWSRAFMKAMIEDPRHAIVLSGYLPQHSGGIPYLHRLRQHERVSIDGHHYKVNALLERAKGLSAHAPATDLRAFAAYMARQGECVAFGMVHGEPAAQDCLAEDVAEANPNVSARSLIPGDPWRPQVGS